MPTFDYVCDACGHRTEVFLRRAADRAPEACPACGEGALKRALSAPRGHVKGNPTTGATCCGRDTPCDTPACSTGQCPL